MDDTTYVLTQKRFLRGSQTLTLDGDVLRAECRRGLSLQEYRFELQNLLPDPIRVKQMPTLKIIGVVLVGTFGPLCLCFGFFANEVERLGVFMFATALLILAVAMSIPVARQIVDVVMFEGPGARLVLWPDLPSPREFNEFMIVLTASIRNAQSCGQDLLRQLRQAGIIDDWQYDQAIELLERKKAPPGACNPVGTIAKALGLDAATRCSHQITPSAFSAGRAGSAGGSRPGRR